MNIHKFITPFVSGLVLLLVGACSENEQENPPSDGIVLRFTPVGSVTRTTGSTDPGTDAENRIDNVAIWCYPKNATDDIAPLYYEKVTGVNSTTEAKILLTEKKLGQANMTISGTYDIYVAANLPAEAIIGAKATPGDLKQYSYTVSSRPSSPFSMTGNSIACDFSKENEVKIPLYRHAVKLGITLVNETSSATWTINSVKIRNDQKTLQLFQPATGVTPVSNTFAADMTVTTTPTTVDAPTYSAYVNENLSNTPTIIEVDATVGAENKKYVAEITPDGAAKLVRNSLCKVTLRLKDAIAKLDIECKITDWNEKKLDGSIQGAYLHTSLAKVHVAYGAGGSVEAMTNATEIHIDWKEAPGFYLSGYQGKKEATVAVANATTDLEFLLSGGTSDVVADGKVVMTANNVIHSMTLTKDNTNLIYDVSSLTVDGMEIKEGEIISLPNWALGQTSTLKITMNTNITWAYKIYCIGNDGLPMGIGSRTKGIVRYDGTLEKSASPQIQYDANHYNNYMPLKLMIDLFLLNHDEKYGDKIRTIEFTVVKP